MSKFGIMINVFATTRTLVASNSYTADPVVVHETPEREALLWDGK